ncbi:MAG TPA: allantoate amidohydrolase [Ferrovibrio sp.]|uniref:allantoate amidohydrolase n=1 Tax=Ferrovibrio sp. TaxID=1917215 RepID=UPI002B4AAF05|nr:allantoate amidohydrolase [Ferrovibrio sp.]HLT77107.1 allantoate amidohydrolase [Ferrovibrio sp.]
MTAFRFADTMLARLDELGRISESPDFLLRTFLTPEQKQAHEKVAGWMREAGMTVHHDAAGNVVGRYEGSQADAPVLMLGSHLDTVRNAGKYDGMLGVIAPIACVADLDRRGKRLDHAIEVVGFVNEEGTRFGAPMTGSRAIAGTFDPAMLETKDRNGVSMGEAYRAFGLDPAKIGSCARRKGSVAAFMELHIEQGPVLENEGLALGVVTAISGARRHRVEITGLAGHAGTVPMGQRQDALVAAAEIVTFIERRCTGTPTLVGTVGMMEALPGAMNVIPGMTRFSIDIRAGDDATRDAAIADVLREIEAVCARRNLTFTVTELYNSTATPCHPALMDAVEAAIRAQGLPTMRLPSGAGHDAATLAPLCPIGMMFMRCTRGISHNPLEAVLPEDVEVATAALLHFIENFRAPVQ